MNWEQYKFQREMLDGKAIPNLLARAWTGQLHPHEPARVCWDTLILLLAIYSCVWDPYKAAFLADWTSTGLDWTLDAFFYFDILLSFRTAVQTEGGVEVDFKRGHVWRTYVVRPPTFIPPSCTAQGLCVHCRPRPTVSSLTWSARCRGTRCWSSYRRACATRSIV